MAKYPKLKINLNVLEQNARILTELCARHQIQTAGVVKGCGGLVPCGQAMVRGGCRQIASSRIENLRQIKEADGTIDTMLIRIPMISELEEVVAYADYSLVSEKPVLDGLEDCAARMGRSHKVVLMYDLGDLREGVFDRKEFVRLALYVEENLKSVQLAGIGTNLSCYGSIVPTSENLGELADAANEIEGKIGRSLELVSGGATTVLPLLVREGLPEGINHLRLGESILSTLDLPALWNCTIDGLSPEAFTLEAEIIECNAKPTHPIGELGVAAFGKKKTFVDRGVRKRAILAIGNMDLGDACRMIPEDEQMKVLGASGDHTIVDIQDCDKSYQVGDIAAFHLVYQGIVYSCLAPTVTKEFISEEERYESNGISQRRTDHR